MVTSAINKTIWKGKRVLIVEDDLHLGFLLLELLEDQGLEVKLLKNGLKAIDHLTNYTGNL